MVARYGGEEFCLLLPGVSPSTAQQRIDQIRAAFASHSALSTAPEFRCSFSAGVCQWQNSLSDAGNFARADDLLYQAKNAGRNCVVGQSTSAA
ncbi:GGDEF domain-containing protein [Chitinibacter sp. FCG-7]|uniref:diguanylate cyclase n=1 Tax=Chitinibacter mangrovi TaxID=3153927 RepID=A0AAU7FDR6_9NEIS